MEKTLSKHERLILANQYEILFRLAKDEDEKINFTNLRDIFTSGYSRYYSHATEFFSEEVSPQECKFVIQVLNLYRDLYFSRKRNKEALTSIAEENVLFKGFDLNDDVGSKYYSFYKFIVEQQGGYDYIRELIKEGKIEGYNSHGFGKNLNELERMVMKRQEIINGRDSILRANDLTLEEIKEILKP
ncbi:TPA: YfbU family protein [Bacillus mycoides]|nr:YfbU family protein [Bacillus mycoides]